MLGLKLNRSAKRGLCTISIFLSLKRCFVIRLQFATSICQKSYYTCIFQIQRESIQITLKQLDACRAELIWGTVMLYLHFLSFRHTEVAQVDKVRSSWRAGNRLSGMLNIMAAGVLAIWGAQASTLMLFAYFAFNHDGVIKWKNFPRYWTFARGIHRPAQMPVTRSFDVFCTRINDWVNNPEAGDLRRHSTHCDVTVMKDRYPEYFQRNSPEVNDTIPPW